MSKFHYPYHRRFSTLCLSGTLPRAYDTHTWLYVAAIVDVYPTILIWQYSLPSSEPVPPPPPLPFPIFFFALQHKKRPGHPPPPPPGIVGTNLKKKCSMRTASHQLYEGIYVQELSAAVHEEHPAWSAGVRPVPGTCLESLIFWSGYMRDFLKKDEGCQGLCCGSVFSESGSGIA